jgi:hypothetical protein
MRVVKRWATIDLWMEMNEDAPQGLSHGVQPTPRYAHTMVLDEKRGVLLVFGGSGSLYLNDLVEIDLVEFN